MLDNTAMKRIDVDFFISWLRVTICGAIRFLSRYCEEFIYVQCNLFMHQWLMLGLIEMFIEAVSGCCEVLCILSDWICTACCRLNKKLTTLYVNVNKKHKTSSYDSGEILNSLTYTV